MVVAHLLGAAYCTTTGYGLDAGSGVRGGSHALVIDGLAPGTTQHVRPFGGRDVQVTTAPPAAAPPALTIGSRRALRLDGFTICPFDAAVVGGASLFARRGEDEPDQNGISPSTLAIGAIALG